MIGMEIGSPTKAGEISRSAELLEDIHKEQGVYFVVAFLYDSGYGQAELKMLMEEMERRPIGMRTPRRQPS